MTGGSDRADITDVATVFVALLVAVLPAVCTWWEGQRLARRLDDATLPERLLASRSRQLLLAFVALGLLAMLAGPHSWWAVPALIGGRIVAGFSFRARLHQETWSLGAYLSFVARLTTGLFGFWILVALTPGLVALGGTRDWIVGLVAAVVLFAWRQAYAPVLRWSLRATPIGESRLAHRLSALAQGVGLGKTRFFRVDVGGGVFANAVALPSTERPAVLVSSTLLDRLDEDEVTAIVAHELAHLEYFDARRLRVLSLVECAIVAAAVLWSPLVRTLVPGSSSATVVAWGSSATMVAWGLWAGVLVALQIVRQHRQQRLETASDLRAVELTGDADALVRALTKLHAIAHLPRRWNADFERHASHPSLARRVQAIGAASGLSTQALPDATTFSDPSRDASVTFLDTGLVWRDNASTTVTLDYAQLTVLSLDLGLGGFPRLVAVDRARRRWSMALRRADLARLQSTLDVVDARVDQVRQAG